LPLRQGRRLDPCSGAEEPDFDADGVGDAGEVAGVAGDDGGLVADGGGDDDGVDDVGDVGGAGGCAGDAGGSAGGRVVGEDVACLEDSRDLVLGSAAPGLGQDDDRDNGADASCGYLVVEGQEVGAAAFGCQ
jgi:hypothetical protein